MSSAVPLTQAVTSGDASAVRAALANGADANERNNGGQTALILAVIFGHTDLVRLLVKAGANPRLRDNLGLDAIEWAQRRGLPVDLFSTSDQPAAPPLREIRVEEPPIPTETPVDTDEKSRKWLAGVKQRIQEQAAQKPQPPVIQQPPVVQPEPEPEPEPKPEPEPEPLVAELTALPPRKRCPKCNAIYNSELVAYCAHHFVRLVGVDEPVLEPPPSTTTVITNTPLLLVFIFATVSIAAFTGYMIMSQLTSVVIPDGPAAAPQQPKGFLKGTPVADGDLAGKAVTLVEAECPLFEGDPRLRANTAVQAVNVHVKLDKTGKVYWARAEGGDEALRNAATEAATQSTFSPDRLHGRETEGKIAYTFTP